MRLAIRLVSVLCLSGLTVTAVSAQVSGQTNCTITSDRSPVVRGIRLHMTAEELLALFPNSGQRTVSSIASTANAPNFGVARLLFQASASVASVRERFAGVDSISITLFDERVTEINLNYTGPGSNPRGPSWSNVDDFIVKLSEAFSLPPPKDWVEDTRWSKILKCNGFELAASTINRTGLITIRDNSYLEIVRQRAAVVETKLRQEFKP